MPPKRHTRASTPPSAKKRAKHTAQPSIDAFFTSPKKPKTATPARNGDAKPAANGGRNGSDEVISIDDSDEEDIQVVEPPEATAKPNIPPVATSPKSSQVDEDARLAQRLAAEWNAGTVQEDKGKGKEKEADFGEWEIEDMNGASSSKRSPSPPPAAPTPVSPKKEKVVHPMFAPKPTPDVKRERKPSPIDSVDIKPSLDTAPSDVKPKITSTTAEPVEPIDFDTDAFLFRPPSIDTSAWPKGRLPYSVLVGVYVQVSSTRSRLTIVRVLTNFLHLLLHASPIDLTPTLYLLSNHLLPSYLPCELGIGSQILSKAIQEVSGVQPRDLKKLWEKWGDPGDIAYEAKSNLRTLVTPAPLLVGDVYKRMLGLSKVKGSQSGKVKGDVVRKLMVQARGEEVRFLVRSLVGNLRIGAVRLTLLTALARATALFHLPSDLIDSVRPIPPPPPKAEKGQKRVPRPKLEPDPARDEVEDRLVTATKLVRKVYVRHPNYGDLVQGIKFGGLEDLESRVPVSVGIPLSPMLGSITRSLEEVFTRLGNLPFTAEAKLDGQRVQIHARLQGPEGEEDGGGRWVQGDDGTRIWVRLFSRYVEPLPEYRSGEYVYTIRVKLIKRHLEDMTEKYPDILALVHTLLSRAVPTPVDFPSKASAPSMKALDLLKAETITSFIMDAEVVAVDKDTGAYRTFQDLSNRAKKDVRVEDIKVVVGIFAFDLMLLNDQTLLDAPFSHRRHLLRTLFPPFSDPSIPTKARFAHVESLDSTSCEDAQAEMQVFFQSVVEQKCEGLMVKLLESGEGLEGDDADDDDAADGSGGKGKGKGKGKADVVGVKQEQVEDGQVDGEEGVKGKGGKKKPLPATYEPDQRSQGWLKVKKDYLEGLGDSLDLVPIGAWWGQGRKAGWWSPILLACHNPETGALEAVCKCISGFTDAFYKDLLVRFPPHNELPEKCNKDVTLGYYETNGLRPDVWFEPSEVWEIRGADITLSPVYPAAASLLGSERGLSMRFPRFMQRRDDKSWEQASTSEQFADMYRRQIKEAPARKSVGVATERDDDEAGRDVSEGHLAEGDLEDDVDGDAPLEQEEGEELSNERVPGDAAQ